MINTPSGDIRDAFFDALYKIAKGDKDLIFLTADMGALSLERFKKDLGPQYINVGVSEQNMVSVAAGLALAGKKVFIYAIAPFVTMRCFEQLKVDVSGMRLPVTIIGAGPGVAYGSDGATHHSVIDLSIMRSLPGMAIYNPSDSITAGAAAKIAYKSKNPVYVRLDKGKPPALYSQKHGFSEGASYLKKGRDVLMISTGLLTHNALKIAQTLQKASIDAGVVDLYRVKPLNEKLLISWIKGARRLVTLEEHSLVGGIGSAVSEILTDNGLHTPLKRLGIADRYCDTYGSREWLHEQYGIDDSSLIKTIRRFAR